MEQPGTDVMPEAQIPCPSRTTRCWQWAGWIGVWLAAMLEVLLGLGLAILLLISPAVFKLSYPVLAVSPHTQDALQIVQWLSSTRRERSLNLALLEGKLTQRELQHYSDVRRVFGKLEWAVGVLTAAVGLLLIRYSRSLRILANVQTRAVLSWLALLLLSGGVAWWDWRHFFAWVHHPLFGDQSWRLPVNCYSLQLFPASFWRMATAIVLAAPGIFIVPSALLIRRAAARAQLNAGFATAAAKHTRPPLPEGRKPTIP